MYFWRSRAYFSGLVASSAWFYGRLPRELVPTEDRGVGFGIIIPILPFLSPQLGADKFDIALIIVTYAACAGLCGPFWGRLSDRIGRKPVLMICMAGTALAYAMLGLATEVWMIFAARGFAGGVAAMYALGGGTFETALVRRNARDRYETVGVPATLTRE